MTTTMLDEKEAAARGSQNESYIRNSSLDVDAMKLAEMGYTQDMRRNFSIWSVLGIAFGLTNSWVGISAGLITGINSGGPVLIVYGIILLALVSTCVGISLSELASAMPNAGGQYFWASELAPKRYSNFAAYITGWFAWTGSIFTSASVALAFGSACVGCYQMSHPDLEIKPWMVVVSYQVFNLLAYFFNCYGKILPGVSKATLWTSLVSFVVTLIAVPAKAPTHQTAKFVFASFVNNTGWSHNGIAFIVGLINANWCFACLDCATHMAEEVRRPERMIPIAIMGTIALGFITAWPYAIAMFFSMNNLERLSKTPTGVPILELYYQALVNKAGAIFLETMLIVTGFGCMIACHAWQARLCWSFARDRGLPASWYLSKVHHSLGIPLRAHTVSCFLVALVGLLYLGSITAFYSMVTACIVLPYISYSVPVICLLIKGRNNIPHGPFWMGPFGLFSNVVLCLWTLFTVIMYSFPAVMPVKAGNMNYASAVYGVVIVLALGYWWIRGRRTFRTRRERREGLARRRSSEASIVA